MGNLAVVSSAPTNSTSPLKAEGLQVFREISTALISLTILTLSCWMMLDTYRTGRVAMESSQADPQKSAADVRAKLDAYGRQKDILLYALALLGTVTGYYLGRVPAELRANTAQNQVTSANNTALQATAKAAEAVAAKTAVMRDATETLSRVLPLISRAREGPGDRGATTASPADLERLQREIQSLLERVART